MGKVKMRNVHDGVVYEFDAGPNNKVLREAIQSGDWTQELNAAQALTKGVADWAPAIGAGLGATAGATSGLASGGLTFGTTSIPGAVAGGAMGGTYGGLGGAFLREKAYDLAGIQRDERLPQMAGRFASEGATGLLGGLGQGVLTAPANKAVTGSLMKRAVGNADAEIEDAMVRRGITVDAKGRRLAQEALNRLNAEKKALIEWATGPGGVRVSWKHFRETLAGLRQRAAEEDPISMSGQQALDRMMKVARTKSEQIRAAAQPGDQPPGQDAMLTPQQVERIRKWADKHVRFYEARRRGMNAPKPGPMENAYAAIAARARDILNEMSDPSTGRNLGEINQEIGELSDIGRAVTRAMSRGHGRDYASSGVGAALGGAAGLWSHDPMRGALLSIPGAAVGYATSNPALLSRAAVNLSRPSVARGVFGQMPGQVAGAASRFMGGSDPQLGPLPEELKPDYMK